MFSNMPIPYGVFKKRIAGFQRLPLAVIAAVAAVAVDQSDLSHFQFGETR